MAGTYMCKGRQASMGPNAVQCQVSKGRSMTSIRTADLTFHPIHTLCHHNHAFSYISLVLLSPFPPPYPPRNLRSARRLCLRIRWICRSTLVAVGTSINRWRLRRATRTGSGITGGFDSGGGDGALSVSSVSLHFLGLCVYL